MAVTRENILYAGKRRSRSGGKQGQIWPNCAVLLLFSPGLLLVAGDVRLGCIQALRQMSLSRYDICQV